MQLGLDDQYHPTKYIATLKKVLCIVPGTMEQLTPYDPAVGFEWAPNNGTYLGSLEKFTIKMGLVSSGLLISPIPGAQELGSFGVALSASGLRLIIFGQMSI